MMKRIVLTGGPGAGKTMISSRIAEAHSDKFVRVPEAATQVYDALQTRWDRLDVVGQQDVQRRIFRLQIEQEDRIANEQPRKILLLDRGTIDGAAYWPDGPADYWRDLGTTSAEQLSRYDMVIWLESSAVLGIYDGDQSNFCRFEDAAGAVRSGERLLELWRAHPKLHRIAARENLDDKIASVAQTILHAA